MASSMEDLGITHDMEQRYIKQLQKLNFSNPFVRSYLKEWYEKKMISIP